MQSNGQEPFCSVVKWSSSKNDGQNFLTPVLAVTTVHMGVPTPGKLGVQWELGYSVNTAIIKPLF